MGLTLDVRRLGRDAAVITAIGEIDVYDAPELRKVFVDLVQEERYRLVLNMDAVDFLDSTGLMVVVGGLKRVRPHNGTMAVVCNVERILKIFRITGIIHVLHVFRDEQIAIAYARDLDPSSPKVLDEQVEVSGNWGTARVYLDDQAASALVEEALTEALAAFGFDVVYSFDPIINSWFRELLVHVRRSGAMSEQLAKLERAVDLQTHLRAQAQIDANQGDAVAKLITALEKTPNAVVQIGSVLLVKVGDDLAVRNLTQRELAIYERKPILFRNPAKALEALQAFAEETSGEANPTDAAQVNGAPSLASLPHAVADPSHNAN